MTDDTPTWREKIVVRILLLVARMFASPELADEIRHLSNHVTTARDRT